MSLSQLKINQSAKITGLGIQGQFRNRLLDLGFVPGTCIKLITKSPAGDPLCYFIRGTMIALRKTDADLIFVKV